MINCREMIPGERYDIALKCENAAIATTDDARAFPGCVANESSSASVAGDNYRFRRGNWRIMVSFVDCCTRVEEVECEFRT